jgi:cation:H+ antiporter
MLLNLLILIIGLTLLLGGGDLLVRGASALARNLGVSPLAIGLTVVAFGTSAPELAINLLASFHGNTDLSFGNIIGSNIANIGLIIGIAALARPLQIRSEVITREIPMLLLATILTVVLGADFIFSKLPNFFDRSDGIVFLLIFCVFIYYTITDVIRRRKRDILITQAKDYSARKQLKSTFKNLIFLVSGIIGLTAGGKLSVDSALKIAEFLNVPEVIIGLTIIAIGTSLPELATSIIATYKDQADLAVGNIVGSNIFNLLLINGLCSSVKPIQVPDAGGLYDLAMMTILTVILLPISITHQKKIVRWEGLFLLLCYITFTIWRISQ